MADWMEVGEDGRIHCPMPNCNSELSHRRFLNHLNACCRSKLAELKAQGHDMFVCPFNPSHHVLFEDQGEHMLKCPDTRSKMKSLALKPDRQFKIGFEPISVKESMLSHPENWEDKNTRKRVADILAKRATDHSDIIKQIENDLDKDPFTPIDPFLRQTLKLEELVRIEKKQAELQKHKLLKGERMDQGHPFEPTTAEKFGDD